MGIEKCNCTHNLYSKYTYRMGKFSFSEKLSDWTMFFIFWINAEIWKVILKTLTENKNAVYKKKKSKRWRIFLSPLNKDYDKYVIN